MESETSILCMNVFNRSLGLLAVESRGTFQPFGEIAGNEYEKIFRVSKHVYMAGSGDFEILENVALGLPILMEEKPASMKILAKKILQSVNFYVDLANEISPPDPLQDQQKQRRNFRSFHGFLVGSLGERHIRTFEIKGLNPESMLLSVKEIFDDGDVGDIGGYAAGTGSRGLKYYFKKLSKKGTVISNDDDVAFHAVEAMKEAIRRDPLSGGMITIVLIRLDSVRFMQLEPLEPNMSHSEYTVTTNYKEEVNIMDD